MWQYCIDTGTLNIEILFNKCKYSEHTMKKRSRLMHHHPEIMLAKQTCIKSTQLKNLHTLSLTKLAPKSLQANGLLTSVKIGQQPISSCFANNCCLI